MSEQYKSFSERHGYTEPKLPQREMLDDDLRNGLWSAFYESFPRSFIGRSYVLSGMYKKVFVDFLKNPVDEYDGDTFRSRAFAIVNNVKAFFLHEKWYLVFNLIEFMIRNSNRDCDNKFIDLCNIAFERENSAYKIVGKFVTEITSKQEIAEIETALRIPLAKRHLEKAITLFSDRETPDYENSIKESIHAVESIAKEITGKEKSLNALTQELRLHPNLTNALNGLYDWTSKDGIRHGKSGKSLAPDQAIARFMLVTCSAFVNYIIARDPK